MALNLMGAVNRQAVAPIPAARSTRMQDVRSLTSLPAGRVVPLVAIPLLREDALRRCSLRFSFEMMETVEVLLNAVNVRVMAYLVSNLAMARFDGMDALNRSYKGVAVEGLAVVPFVETFTGNSAAQLDVHKYLGLHHKTTDVFTMQYLECYNAIWNFRARNRSQDLNPRGLTAPGLAPAFWQHQHFRHIVPDFDQAVIDGEVPLNIISGDMPLKGIGFTANTVPGTTAAVKESSGTSRSYTLSRGLNAADMQMEAKNIAGTYFPAIFAQMQENGITVSLSNIELARKTQAFARIKERYQGLTDEYIIDLLMSGIAVPEQAMNQPILLGDVSTVFGMSKRYATDSANLTDSVVNGATFLDLTIRTPPVNAGGIVMVTAEILPEQLFERQRDPYLFATQVHQYPDYLRDTLDPEKVDIVPNGQIDAAHATPAGTFGYAPLNHKWMITQPRLGGRFHREDPASVTNDEVRQRVWAVETVNPTLAADFYISTNIHTKPFVVTNQDPFECVTRGVAMIEGLTVFGGALVESTGSYDEVMAKADMDRIDNPGIIALDEESETKPAPKEGEEVKKPKEVAKPKVSSSSKAPLKK